MHWLFSCKQKNYYHPAAINAVTLPGSDRGVFAATPIPAGAIIEIAPVILLSETDKELLTNTSLFHHYFLVPDKKTPVALGLGYSSIYTHASRANASYQLHLAKQYIIMKACKSIQAGERITLNFNGEANDASPVYIPPASIPADLQPGMPIVNNNFPALYFRDVKQKGRSVFSTAAIRAGDCFARFPLLILQASDYAAVMETQLADYFFSFNKEEQVLALALGFGSLFNHATHSNATYTIDHTLQQVHFFAVKDIPENCEICINYGGEPGKVYEKWFADRGIRYVE